MSTKQSSLTNADDACAVDCSGAGSVGVQLTGTWTGTVSFEATIDGTNWFAVYGQPPTAAPATTATANGKWIVGVVYNQFRVRFSTATSGTVVANVSQISAAAASAGTAANALSGGYMGTSAVELTRPSDTNAYAANDAISDSTNAPTVAFAFTLARVASGTGYITKAKLSTDQKTCTARFRLYLFNASTITPINDNAVQTYLYANAASYMGHVDFPACSTEDSSTSTGARSLATMGVSGTNLPIGFVADANSKLYGLLETLDAFSPASGQKIRISLESDNN